ncbi:MAG: DMSO reductase anchor subunit [Dokdonia sp.]|jgi:hypothetical protein
MEIDTLRLLFDVGLFVLIWMIQLIVYPSFLFYEMDTLVAWHKKYTVRLSIIVIPLMFGQLILSSWQWYESQTLATTIHLVLVVAVWISTFLQFVPIHTLIAKHKATRQHLEQLVKRNWIRTALWTLLCFWSIFLLYSK